MGIVWLRQGMAGSGHSSTVSAETHQGAEDRDNSR